MATALQMSAFVRGEDDKWLVASDIHSEGGLRGTGAPSHCHLFGRLAPKDHKWLVHTGCQHSFVSEDDKWLEPTGHRMSAWALE